MAAEFELYKDKAGEYRWCLRADNNEIACSPEGCKNKGDCLDEIELVRKLAPTVQVNDKT